MNQYRKFSISIVITSLLLCGNALAKPDVEKVGRLQDEVIMSITAGTTGNSEPVLEVPEGMTAIVKFVSGRTFTPVDSWVSCTVVKMIGGAPIGSEGAHHVIVQKRFRVSDYSHEFSQEMEFYVGGGLQAGFTCTMHPAPTQNALIGLNMTAILVDDSDP
jgi:hypothetical protein